MKPTLLTLFLAFGTACPTFSQTAVFEADFESSTSATIGSIDYNAGSSTTAVATRVPTSSSDPVLGSHVLWLDRNETGVLSARFDFSSVVDLTSSSATISFDAAARRANGASKTTMVYGYDSSDNRVFGLVLGDLDAFGNGSGDRQRPGFETGSGGRQILPAPNTPGSYWFGSDSSTASFDVTRDSHFELTIRSSSWDLSTSHQNSGATYLTSGLSTFDGTTMSSLAYLTLETYTGTSFGNYWDNFLVTSAALPTPVAYYFTGISDGVSLFAEGNWNTSNDGSGAAIPSIAPGLALNHDLIIESGNPGGGGASGELVLGSASLSMMGGTLAFASGFGISEGELSINGAAATITASAICDSDVDASAGATITLTGPFLNTPIVNSGAFLRASSLSSGSDAVFESGAITLHSDDPLIGSTVAFTATSSGVLELPAVSPGDAASEVLSKLSVGGVVAELSGNGKNLSILPDGGGGSIVAVYSGFIDTDNDSMDDEWEISFFGNLSQQGTGDVDGDGLNDLGEYNNATDPTSPDSDDDLLTDGAEVLTHNTNPIVSDSDGDSNPDGYEISKGTDPNDISSKTERPNILFLFADDLGYGDLGVLFQNAKSGKKHKTPFFDQMAADGLILDRHYCPAPVCAPSRGSLLTGMHQGHANVRNNQFDRALEDNHNLATTLKKAGYATSIIGKWGLQGGGGSPELWPAYPTNRGFDYFFGYVGHGDGHTHYPFHTTDSRGPKRLYDQDKMIRDDLSKCFTPDLFTARAKKLIIDEVNDGDEQPFFIYLAYDTPHAALQLPTVEYPGENNSNDLDASGLGASGGVQYNGVAGSYINTATGTIDSYRHPNYTADVGNTWTDVEERFATLVRRMDDNLGDLRKTLEDLGIEDNTLIVLTSDNGPHSEDYLATNQTSDGSSYLPSSFSSYGPFEGIKRDCWEGGIREPSLVCWPNSIPASSISTQHSQFHDWLPTFCELAGVPTPARTDGVSLVPTLLDPSNPGSNGQLTPTTYIEYSTSGTTPNYSGPNHGGDSRSEAQVIFLDDYKGIRVDTTAATKDFEIYETISDPSESMNLAGSSPYFDELQQRMKDRVLQLRVPGASADRPYDNVEIPTPTSLSPLTPGIHFESFTGNWPWLPEFEDLTPDSTGVFQGGVELSSLTSTALDEGLYLSAYLNVPSAGNWTFSMSSDSGAVLKIHEIVALDDDFNHDGGTVSRTLNLAAGFHPVRIYYRNKSTSEPSLDLHWSGPGVAEEEIPASAFFIEGIPDPVPVVNNDQATTMASAIVVNPVTISPLDNDIDDGLPVALSVSSFSQPSGGSVTRSGDELTFTPDLGFYGTTSFSYTATDGANFVRGFVEVNVIFDSSDIWLPFQECGGSSTFRANGEIAGSLSSSVGRIEGQHGYALSFNGSDSEFSLSGISAAQVPSGSQARTAMAWMRVPIGESFENQTLFGYGVNSNGQRFSFRLNGSGGTNNPGTPHQAVRLEVQGGSIVGNTFVDDGLWHHLAIVCDDFNNNGSLEVEETRIYVDGVLDTDPAGGIPAGFSSARVMNTSSSQAVLGGSNHSGSYSFRGDIDEFRLYSEALTTAAIQAVFNGTHQVAAAWHRQYFGEATIDWDADDDGDGVNRLSEYAFAGQPQVADSLQTIPLCEFEDGKLSLTFRRRDSPALNDLNYVVEGSRNLMTWPLTTIEESRSALSLSDCLEEVSFISISGVDSEDRQFVRIRSELSP